MVDFILFYFSVIKIEMIVPSPWEEVLEWELLEGGDSQSTFY